MKTFRPSSMFLLLSLFGGALTSSARADVIFTLGNNPQPDEQNILLNNGQTGTTVTGVTNQTHTTVVFSSITDILTAPANGQARIEAVEGALHNISITLPDAGTYGDLIFNPDITGVIGTPGGTAHVTVVTSDAVSHPFDYTLGNGSNFLTITTAAGQRISSTTIDYERGFTDLRQIRISGIASSVPEPSSLALLLGCGLSGSAFALRRLRRR